MDFRPQAIALLAAPALALAVRPDSPPPVTVTVTFASEALMDPTTSPRAELRATEAMLQSALKANLSNLVCGAGALAGTGPGPWRARVDILEWISPSELRGAFGQDVPGIAAHASLTDLSRGDGVALALAEFPAPAQRLAIAKSLRVLPIDDAAQKIAQWIITEITAALANSKPDR
ncbi:MAG TPA: hypothetical protein PLU30_09415 [Verrucomicrobiae bacterium]|nr:hypothetical protein [Verrucomicrobiae bacterium]